MSQPEPLFEVDSPHPLESHLLAIVRGVEIGAKTIRTRKKACDTSVDVITSVYFETELFL